MEVNSSVTEDNGLEPYPGDKLRGVTQTLIMTLVTILIIVGNLTNIVVISQSLKAFSITGHFMISLAFADLGESIHFYQCLYASSNSRCPFTSLAKVCCHYVYRSLIHKFRSHGTNNITSYCIVCHFFRWVIQIFTKSQRKLLADHAAVYCHV